MTFAERLLLRRKELGLSQEALAERLQVSRQAVSRWETGDAMPDMGKLLLLADVLDCSLDELCGRERETAPASGSAAETGHRRKRSWLLPGVFLVLGLLTGAIGTGICMERNTARAEESTAASVLPDTFTVTGVRFTGQSSAVAYRFIPSITDADCTYQITFTDTKGDYRIFDAVCSGGICSGTAGLSSYDVFQVTVTVRNGSSSRSTAVAVDLVFADGSASWRPVEQE